MVLDGGLPKWKSELLPVENGKKDPERNGSPPDTSFRLDTRVIKYLDEINRLEMPEYSDDSIIIDGRPIAAFNNGSINKKSVNLNPSDLFDLQRYATLKPIEARQLALATKINGENNIIFSCQRGIVAALLFCATHDLV